ncbi:MAG: 50S ribosomal protein L22 [Candidatus Omnitrophica bacterium]|nr:50S ribosomal protein L22 [Candidatus Omnitrophota bacterium]
MNVKAQAKYIRVSPQKARLVLPHIKGKKALVALTILENMPQKTARLTLAVLNSAIANAKNKKMNLENCIISDARVDEGPTLKRLMTRAMGRADRLLRRTSHVMIELTEETAAGAEQEKVTTSSRR